MNNLAIKQLEKYGKYSHTITSFGRWCYIYFALVDVMYTVIQIFLYIHRIIL